MNGGRVSDTWRAMRFAVNAGGRDIARNVMVQERRRPDAFVARGTGKRSTLIPSPAPIAIPLTGYQRLFNRECARQNAANPSAPTRVVFRDLHPRMAD